MAKRNTQNLLLYSILDVLSVLFLLMMARYCWFRTRFFLHVYQQIGYKHNEYWEWLKKIGGKK